MSSRTLSAAVVTVLLAATAVAAHAADTAYTALQVVGKKLGNASLNRVTQVSGRFGAPEPQIWTITLFDPREGVRELEVQKGKVTADRSPRRRASGPAMDFNKLMLDSEGVFTIVNEQAQKAKVPFDRVDYTLNAERAGVAPVWHLELWDGQNGQVGRFAIAADDGKILNGGFERVPSQPRITQRDRVAEEEDREFLEEERLAQEDRDYERRRYEEEEERVEYRRGSSSGGFLGKVERHFERRGRQIRKFFSGGYFHD